MDKVTTTAAFRKLALSFSGTIEAPHFERTSFRVKNRIFATLHEATGIATLMFSKTDQRMFCEYDKSAVYPVPNKWGEKGATFIELRKVPLELVQDALETAYKEKLKVGRKRKGQ